MKEENKKECEHEIGRQVIGGFAGHEHTHPTGKQFCFNCGKTLKEILSQTAEEAREEYRKEVRKNMPDFLFTTPDQTKEMVEGNRGHNQKIAWDRCIKEILSHPLLADKEK